MRQPRSSRERRHTTWIAGGWAAVALLTAGVAAPAAQASHHNTEAAQTHVRNMHYTTVNPDAPGALDKQYCGEVTSSSYLTQARRRPSCGTPW